MRFLAEWQVELPPDDQKFLLHRRTKQRLREALTREAARAILLR